MKNKILIWLGRFILLASVCFAQPGGGAGDHITSEAQHPLRHRANRVTTDTTNFNNNLGVGDTSVQNALDTIDNLALGGDITSVGSCTTGDCFVAGDSDTLLGNRVGIGATSASAYLNIQSSTGSSFILKVADSGPNDRLVIQQDGSVGIGLTNPSTQLHLTGDITIAGDNIEATTETDRFVWMANGTTYAPEAINLGTDTTGGYVQDVADGTGIDGTATGETSTYTPTLDLTEINSLTWGAAGAFTTMTFDSGATDPVLTATNNALNLSTGNMGIGTTLPVGLLQVGTSPTGLTVLVGGRVGIGNTSPASGYRLEVTGDSKFSGDVNITGNLTAVTDQTVSGNIIMTDQKFIGFTSPSGRLLFSDQATDVLAFLNSNVGIGLTNPAQKLDIIGNILASGTIAGNILTGTNVTSGADPGHTHTGTSLSSIDISDDTNLSGDTENVLTGDALSIGAAITRDTEWNTIDFLTGTATASLSAEIVAGTAPSGDLGGTWASPSVTDDSHAHTTTTISGVDISADTNLAVTAPIVLTDDTISVTVLKDLVTTAPLTGGTDDILPGADADITIALTVAKDIVAGVGLSGGEDNVLPGADADTTLTFDATELSALTWSAGGSAQFSWDWNLSGTDPKMNFNSNSINIETGNFGIANTAPTGLLQVGTTPGVPILFVNNNNVGIGTSNPARKFEVIGATKTGDTLSSIKLNIINTPVGTLPGAVLSIQKNLNIERIDAQIVGVGATNILFGLMEYSSEGTTPLYSLVAGQTATTALLTITSGSITGKSVPSGNLVVPTINTVNGGATAPSFRLQVYTVEY